MAQWVKTLATKPEDLLPQPKTPSDLHIPSMVSACAHTNKYKNTKRKTLGTVSVVTRGSRRLSQVE